MNGYGAHRIEGIGDKHVPWIHNVKNTDLVAAIDDEACMQIMRLFNEEKGLAYLKKQGVGGGLVNKLSVLGISSIGNLLAAIKTAKYYELSQQDILFTVFTDSMELYASRLLEEGEKFGRYDQEKAAVTWHRYVAGTDTNYMQELTYPEKRRVHNLKYFTWVEQQGKNVEELDAQWYDRDYWNSRWNMAAKYDRLIEEFNKEVGLL
jgi:hypothetical protein